MSKQTKKQLENLTKVFDEKHGGDKEARQIPICEGDVFTFTTDDSFDLFTQRDEKIGDELRSWVDVNSIEGVSISATQLTRRNNGLPLVGKTISERIASFLNLFTEEGVLTLKVTGIRTKTFKRPDGSENTSSYYVFSVIEGATEEGE